MADSCPLLPPDWAVPNEFRRRLGDQVGRQRMMEADGHLLLVLHAPPRPDSSAREGLFFWRDPAGRWTPPDATPDRQAVGDLLADYERALDGLHRDEDEARSARQFFDLLNQLNPLVRAARNLQNVLEDARLAAPEDRQILLWRDRAYVAARSLELLHADAKNGLDFAVAQRAEEEVASNRRVEAAAYRLNVLVACFFPIATLAAIFGMSFHNGLEAWDEKYKPWPLVVVLVFGLGIGIALTRFITRPPRT
jgi:hypothetical protein